MSTQRTGADLPGNASTLIFRQVSFRLAAFDRLKEYQRHLERTEGRRVSNSEAIDRLILSHPST